MSEANIALIGNIPLASQRIQYPAPEMIILTKFGQALQLHQIPNLIQIHFQIVSLASVKIEL